MGFGPYENMPGSPWYRQTKLPGTQAAPPNFAVSQTVQVKSRFQANPGVLVSGRRPERPGKS